MGGMYVMLEKLKGAGLPYGFTLGMAGTRGSAWGRPGPGHHLIK